MIPRGIGDYGSASVDVSLEDLASGVNPLLKALEKLIADVRRIDEDGELTFLIRDAETALGNGRAWLRTFNEPGGGFRLTQQFS